MKYSAGVKAPPHIHSGDYYAVVVSGNFRHFLESENEYKVLTAGATWVQKVTLSTKTVVYAGGFYSQHLLATRLQCGIRQKYMPTNRQFLCQAMLDSYTGDGVAVASPLYA